MRILKREIKVFEDFEDQILEDYVKNTYNDVKQNEDKDNAEIIEEFEAIKKEELDGDSFS